jgi:protein O-mannosyl-transferase
MKSAPVEPAANPAGLSSFRLFLAVLLIVGAGALAYHGSFKVPFVFDDDLSILANPTIRSWAHAWSPPVAGGTTVSGRPLLNLTFALNFALSGTAPWSYHAFNLLIHLASALLLFGIVRRTLLRSALAPRFGARSFEIAVASALLWMLHPLQTESVTYVVQRAESLMGLLFLLTLWCFIRAAEAGNLFRWYTGAFVACALGMATKEVMAVTPLAVALYDRAFLADSWRAVWARRRGVHVMLASTWLGLFALVAATGDRGGTFDLTAPAAWWRYDLTQFIAVARYLGLAVWPAPLVIDYGTFWVTNLSEVLVPALLVLTLLIATGIAWRRSPAVAFAGVWFFLILAPTSVLPGTIQMIVEHRTYLPIAGLIVAGVIALHAVVGRRTWWVLAAVAMGFGALSARRNTDYATPVRLFTDTVAKRPQNARAMALLGDYHRRIGHLDEARQWLERSLAVEPGVVPVLNNLGDIWQELGEPAKAATCFGQALARQPHDVTTLNNLGNALVLSGDATAGISRLQEALRLAPEVSTTRLNLAHALARCGQKEEAAAAFAELLRRHPENAEVHSDYAMLLQDMGRPTDALNELRVTIRLKPQDAEMHDRLGVALGRAGRLREALAEFETALRLNPADETARRNAAVARRRLQGN